MHCSVWRGEVSVGMMQDLPERDTAEDEGAVEGTTRREECRSNVAERGRGGGRKEDR